MKTLIKWKVVNKGVNGCVNVIEWVCQKCDETWSSLSSLNAARVPWILSKNRGQGHLMQRKSYYYFWLLRWVLRNSRERFFYKIAPIFFDCLTPRQPKASKFPILSSAHQSESEIYSEVKKMTARKFATLFQIDSQAPDRTNTAIGYIFWLSRPRTGRNPETVKKYPLEFFFFFSKISLTL